MALNAKRPWVIAGAAAVVAAGIGAGFTANADDDVRLNDVRQAPAATMSSDAPGAHQQQAATDDSPESADSPAESPVDSPGSANTPDGDQDDHTPDDTPGGDSPDAPDQTADSPDDDD